MSLPPSLPVNAIWATTTEIQTDPKGLTQKGDPGGRVITDLDISSNQMAESARRVIDRAEEEALRRGDAFLANEHIFRAFAQVEWDMFAEIMRDVSLDPRQVLRALDDQPRTGPPTPGSELKVAPPTKLLFKLAMQRASRAGRKVIEAADLFCAVFEETRSTAVSILRRDGVEPRVMTSTIAGRIRDYELREERLKRQFELPPFLKQWATNLNRLARQDRLPPLIGREFETRQVMEILALRERANSVLLIGEPGVGKTAVAEGLARLIELESRARPTPVARLSDREPADERAGGRNQAARHVRGAHRERHPGNQGASEPDPLH